MISPTPSSLVITFLNLVLPLFFAIYNISLLDNGCLHPSSSSSSKPSVVEQMQYERFKKLHDRFTPDLNSVNLPTDTKITGQQNYEQEGLFTCIIEGQLMDKKGHLIRLAV